MTYTITRNPEFDSIEILFDGKPIEAVRNAIKSLGFRWHKTKGIWYGYGNEDDIKAVIDSADSGCSIPASEKPIKKSADPTKELLPKYRKYLEDVWGNDKHMVDYCMGEVSQLVELDNGMMIEIEKQSIEKDFCFGYSDSRYDTKDYDDASEMAHHARTSEDYFRQENMKGFQDMLDRIDGKGEYGTWCGQIFFLSNHYIDQKESNLLRSLSHVRTTTFLDAMGGSAYLDGLKGTTVKAKCFSSPIYEGMEMYIPTDDDMAKIREAYVRAYDAHKKRVETYLKKYGLKNVHAWTYWRDE